MADARASLATLDATGSQLPDVTLYRQACLRREAQSTGALEGVHAPLHEVLVADEDRPSGVTLREVLNFIIMAERGSSWVEDERPLNTHLLTQLQGILMTGLPLETSSGRLRDVQVVIGVRDDVDPLAPAIERSRFVPSPPGAVLEAAVRELADWIGDDHGGEIDPVVAAAMAHYQFEALHPFPDGNGRVGRYLVMLHLHGLGILADPTLIVSPWFEGRRALYYDRLLAVSTDGDWDSFVAFFAEGLAAGADVTRHQLRSLARVRESLHEKVRGSRLRAATSVALADLAIARISFSVRQAAESLDVSYPRANTLVAELMEIGVLDVVDPDAYRRRFFAPAVHEVVARGGWA